jgi:hypothetical protein
MTRPLNLTRNITKKNKNKEREGRKAGKNRRKGKIKNFQIITRNRVPVHLNFWDIHSNTNDKSASKDTLTCMQHTDKTKCSEAYE